MQDIENTGAEVTEAAKAAVNAAYAAAEKQDVTVEVDFDALDKAHPAPATREITVTVKFRVPVKVTRRAVATFVNDGMDEAVSKYDIEGWFEPADWQIGKADAWSADGVKKQQHGHGKKHGKPSVSSSDGTPAGTAEEIASVALSFPGAPTVQGAGPVIVAQEESSASE